MSQIPNYFLSGCEVQFRKKESHLDYKPGQEGHSPNREATALALLSGQDVPVRLPSKYCFCP